MRIGWVAFGSFILLGVAFSVGIVVGQRIERLTPTSPNDPSPIAKIDQEQTQHEELTFYAELTDKDAPTAVDAAPPTTPEPETKATPQSAVGDQVETGPHEASAPTPKKPAEPSARDLAMRIGEDTENEDPSRVVPDVLFRLKGPAQKGEYTVQVSSFQTGEEATAYAADLERRGYHPFIVSARITGRGTWFRVRIGRFEDETTALKAKELLARADLPGWVLRTE